MILRLTGLAAAAALAAAPAGNAADGNVVTDSAAVVQVSAPPSGPITIETPVLTVTVQAPLELGSGGNSTGHSVGAAQVGGGHATDDAAGSADVGTTSAGPAARRDDVPATVPHWVNVAPLGPLPDQSVEPVQGLALALRSLWLQAKGFGVSPGFILSLDPVARVVLDGSVRTGPTAGDESGSLLAVQAGPVTVAPSADVQSSSLNTSVRLGGSSGIEGNGANHASDSVGVVQLGGPNTTSGSTGVVQTGGLVLGPTVGTATPLGTLAVGGSSGAAGGANGAADSLGAAQIGGGNGARGVTGAVQSTGVSLGPTASATGTPIGGVAVGGERMLASTAAASAPENDLEAGTARVATAKAAGRTRTAARKPAAAPAAAPARTSTGTLPFTGLDLLATIILGGALLLSGVVIRGRARG